ASVITAEISVPHKIHSSLIGGGGRLIQHIAQTECGGVQIKFPSEKTQSDKITIRGHKEGVEKAKKMLTDLAKDRELTGYTAEVKAKPELFRFLIGRGGSKIHKLRESNPKVKIMLPRSDDADQETIHIVGCKEDVEAAKKQLELIVTELVSIKFVNDLTEIHVDIDPRHHRHFVGRGATVIHEVQDQCGGVVISFPKQNTNSSAVSVKGGKECCESAKKRLLEIVDDLESQVTIKVVIPQRHHGQLLSNRGAKIQEITHRCNVQIKFPERGGRNSNATTQSDQTTSNSASPVNNTATSNGHDASPNGTSDATTTEDENATDSKDIISITGRPEKCEEAKELLIAEIPVSETVNVPFDFHRILIGRNGAEIRKLMDRHHVFIRIPQQEEHSDEITVTGSSSNVAEAISSLMAKVEELEEEAKEKELKSFQASVSVPAEYHSKLIGPKGSEINRIRQKFDVQITIPLRNSENVDEIIITGFEKNANECKEEIERIISEYKSLYTIEVTLDSRIHNRIIGQRGRSVRKIMDDFGVEIRFPRSTDPNPNLIVITGKNEETVYDCIDHLRNLEEEYLQVSNLF
uniref:K Homology domain-containing protein n=1 Tax=Romanomermis culicivorax TaxID=13658 RepID=A0A915K9J6_ROMCU